MKQGTQYTSLLVDKMTVEVGDDVVVTNVVPFLLEVKFYYEEAIKATEDEPPCEEHIQVLELFVNTPVYLGNGEGISLAITQGADLFPLVDCAQLHNIKDAIKRGNGELYGTVTLD